MDALWQHVGISASGVAGVIVATTVLYLAFVAVLHFWGARYLAAGSATSMAVFAVLGSLSARAMLGDTPTLCGAIVAIITLFLLEFTFARLRAATPTRILRGEHHPRAWAVMIDGRPCRDSLAHNGLSVERLHERLRAGGVRRLDDVALAVLEPRGSLTIIRRGEDVDPALLVGVSGLTTRSGSIRLE